MSLLTIIQAVTRRVGIPTPSVVATSTDAQILQLFALANEQGHELARAAQWQALNAEATFITTATVEQTNTPVPEDLDRFIQNTFYNRTQARPMIGPLSPQEWQAIVAFPVFARIYLGFRQRDGAFLVQPIPAAGETIAYEYMSSYWAKSSADQPKAEFTSDDDGTYLDEQLMIQGLRWRWKQAKGLDYSEDFVTYQRNLSESIAQDGGMTAVLGAQWNRDPVLALNIPDGNYGL
jgi:hypothetical protein